MRTNPSSRVISGVLALVLAFAASLLTATPSQAGAVGLTVTRVGWNVVGLDSNNVNSGPNQFPQEVEVCNTSTDTAAAGVTATWNWTSANALIALDGSATKTIGSIPANSCVSAWWTVNVTRNASAYDTSRNYTVDVADSGAATATTGTQLVYVEHLISQNRNVVNGVAGPTAVTVGQTVQFVLTGATATQGYEQIVTAPILDSSIFEITSVVGTYAVGGSIHQFYFDACTWDPAGTSRLNWNCLATGKAGGDPITVTVTAKVIGTGSATIGGIIYDFSGSSFHYNSDFSTSALNVTASPLVRTIDAVADSSSTNINTAKEIDLLANDTASNGTLDPASVSVTGAASHGSVTIDPATGKATYTPNNGYTGTDTFKYTVCLIEAPATCEEVTVTVTISDPTAITVTATDESRTTNVDVAIDIPVVNNDTVTGGTLSNGSITIVTQPLHGTVTRNLVTGEITYEPNTKYVGTDSFVYSVCSVEDPTVCDEATVTITIVDVEESGTQANPKLEEKTIEPGKPLVIDPNTLDPNVTDVDPTTIEVITPPESGTVEIDPTTGEITYTPPADFEGLVTFTFKIASRGNPLVFTYVTYQVQVGANNAGAVDDKTETLASTGAAGWPLAPFVGSGLILIGLGLGFVRASKKN
ncbi:MAG: hypothetical protein RLZ71_33 [Actinomycetota bacterium]|jgi:hypothetical protein